MAVPGGSQAISSFLVRVVEGGAQIKVQNLKTGEMRSFKGWGAFLDYVRTQPRFGTLK